MNKAKRIPFPWKWLLAFLPSLVLTALFYALKDDRAVMDFWVHRCMAPVMQAVGKFWSLVPFSAAEVLTACFLAGTAVWLVRAVVLLVRSRAGTSFLRRLLAWLCAAAWLWTAFCWTWNCTYYATGFAQRYHLSKQPYTAEQLLQVTLYFAQQCAALSTQVPREEDLSFAQTPAESFDQALRVYDNLCETYPLLALSDRQAKPLACSRLQSILGYTGVYFPFTGEANVNVDQSRCLVPFTIAHEMAHQRMVAAEEECNFLGVLACVTSGNPAFQYSGYMMGLIYLTNALNDLSPALVQEIMRQFFTDELSKDWADNYHYWQSLKSPTQEAANQAMDTVYDSFLKSQGQSLGLLSYSACVDLLVNYFHPDLG